jgi:hypothetical protein
MVSSIYYGDIDLAINHKNGFYTMTLPGDSPADSGVLPLPETLESSSIRAALPRTGELSAGEANDEIARNAGAGVVPAAEIPFQLSANLISMDDDAYAKWRTTWASMARERDHEHGHHGDRSGGIDTSTADASGMSQTEKRRSWWQNNRSNPA